MIPPEWPAVLSANPTRLDRCETGHPHHATRLVTTDQQGPRGPLRVHVFAWEWYANTEGYCTGDDEVSRGLDDCGTWEPNETAVALHILRQGPPGVVLDLGAHVGWYSLLAAAAGHQVLAVDADPEHVTVLRANAALNWVGDRVTAVDGWIDEVVSPLTPVVPVRLAKVDIEGHEAEAVRVLAPLLESQQIDAVLIELSPVFGNAWEGAFSDLRAAGYECLILNGEEGEPVEPNDLGQWPQVSALFTAPGITPP